MKKKSLIMVLLAAPLAFGVVACNKSDSTAAQVEQQLAEAKAQAEKAEQELAALREQEAAAKAEEAQKQLEAAQAEAEAARKEAEDAKARAAAAEKASKKKQAAAAVPTPVVSKPEPKPVCQDCGTVAGVTAVQVQGEGSGMGAVAGAIAGAVIGHQFGRGQGNTAAKVVGAAGGGYAGNEIEKRIRTSTVYDVTVQMDNGSTRTVRVADPSGISSGERVRVEGGNLIRI